MATLRETASSYADYENGYNRLSDSTALPEEGAA